MTRRMVKLQVRISYINITHHVGCGDMWYAMWILMAREIWPYEVGSHEEWKTNTSWLQVNE
jgi:hypothetical protein